MLSVRCIRLLVHVYVGTIIEVAINSSAHLTRMDDYTEDYTHVDMELDSDDDTHDEPVVAKKICWCQSSLLTYRYFSGKGRGRVVGKG